MEWNREALIRLREILARLFPASTDARRIASDSGLNLTRIEFENKPINNWFNILELAQRQAGRVEAILQKALEEFPDDLALQDAQRGTPPPVLQGPEARDWHGTNNTSQLEKIIGSRSTLVQISYFENGLIRARSVARVKLADGSLGTGFLTEGNILMTNHHVLPSPATANSAVAQFNYQQTAGGLSAPVEELKLSPGEFFETSATDDWTAVRIDGNPVERWGTLELTSITPKRGDHVNIIQHAGGGPKQISFLANVIVFVGNGRVQYLTDTLPGSSGSPVFDQDWNLIAVHHSGGWLDEPGAKGNTTYYRNEGILMDCILRGLRTH